MDAWGIIRGAPSPLPESTTSPPIPMRVKVISDKNLYVEGKNYLQGEEFETDDVRGANLVKSGDAVEIASPKAPVIEDSEPAVDVPKKKGKAVRDYGTK